MHFEHIFRVIIQFFGLFWTGLLFLVVAPSNSIPFSGSLEDPISSSGAGRPTGWRGRLPPVCQAREGFEARIACRYSDNQKNSSWQTRLFSQGKDSRLRQEKFSLDRTNTLIDIVKVNRNLNDSLKGNHRKFVGSNLTNSFQARQESFIPIPQIKEVSYMPYFYPERYPSDVLKYCHNRRRRMGPSGGRSNIG